MEKKSNLVMMIISSVVCLLPIIPALVIYNDLPEQLVMQWDLDGNPNWYAHKAAAAFGIPLFFMLLNIVVRIILSKDPKRENQSKAMRAFAEWIVPFFSLVLVPILLYSAMGADIPVIKMAMVFMGIVVLFCGNYMNKNKQNYSAGIRISWTLNDSDNWSKTHRMAGFLWIFGGIIFIIVTFLPLDTALTLFILFSIIAILVMVPILYSYSLYRKSKKTKSGELS